MDEETTRQEMYLDEDDDVERIFAELRLNILDNLELSRLYHRVDNSGKDLVAAREKYLGLRREATMHAEKVEEKERAVLQEAFRGEVIRGKNKDEREFMQTVLLAGQLEGYSTPTLTEYLRLKKAQNEKNLAVSDAHDALILTETRFEALKPLVKIAEALSRLVGN